MITRRRTRTVIAGVGIIGLVGWQAAVAPAAPAKPKPKPKPVVVAVSTSTRALPAKGGTLTLKAKVRHANTCLLTVRETTPSITPFVHRSYTCSAGHVRIPVNIPANKSTTAAATWSLILQAKGPGGLSPNRQTQIKLAKSTNVTPPPTQLASPPPSQPPPPVAPPPPSGGAASAAATARAGKPATTSSSRPLPGRSSSSSSFNWSGYVATSTSASAYSGIVGEWQVPTVKYDPGKYLCEWVGVDGASNNNLIQVGTESDGSGTDYAWYEINPLVQPQQIIIIPKTGNAEPVKPGDFMYAYTEADTDIPYMWKIHLEDITQNWTFDQNFSYDGPETSAEWVTEATEVNKTLQYPANFGSMWFDSMEEFTNGQWYLTNYDDGERVYMQPEGSTSAAAGPDLPGLFNGYQYFYDEYTGT